MVGTRPVVLIVDDEPLNLTILSESLKDEGFKPVCAENGRAAWNLLKEHPSSFSAVLLDRMMPEMDGMEVLACIKEHPSLCSLPVILQTAKAAKEDVLEGLKAGANYYITKPFEVDKMIAIVRTAVNEHQNHLEAQNVRPKGDA